MPATFDSVTLTRGDAVALIAPASGQKTDGQHLVSDAIELLRSWGLAVVQTPVLNPQRYLAADDNTRAEALHQALTHPDIKAIFTTRGGYGCARLLPYLGDIVIPTPRLVVGFSDITTLHVHFTGQPNYQGLHAPCVATQQLLGDNPDSAQNREALQQTLFTGRPTPLRLTTIQHGISNDAYTRMLNAPTAGGCLSLLVTSLGTPHEIQTKGKTLLIEEVGESPYSVDRMLTHLKNAGKLNGLAGLIIGEMVNCCSPHIDIEVVLGDVLGELDCPVYSTQDFGHGAVNLPWFYQRPLTHVNI